MKPVSNTSHRAPKHVFTAAVFDLTQQNTSVTEGSITRQVGEVRVRGLELEASADVTESLKLVGSLHL